MTSGAGSDGGSQRNTVQQGGTQFASQHGNVTVDQSKRFKFGGGYSIAAAAVLVAALTGAGGYAYYQADSDDKPDVSSIGTAPGETGVRDTWKAFQNATTRKDASTVCALLTVETRRQMGTAPDSCTNDMKQSLEDPASGAAADASKIVIKITIRDDKAEIELHSADGTPTSPAYMIRKAGYWRVSGDSLCKDFHSSMDAVVNC
ncbi:hypothetical protein ABZ545_06535 [Streptomyces abikoensis]|uniref:hypothetical protein n=1 Tax=Streptomyces abikoensis TaxID=97398 RepID=UPI0033E61870